MLEKIGKGVLVLILTAGVLLGAYLGLLRYQAEIQNRTVELVFDLNDLKKMASFEKKPMGPILEALKKLGFSSVGVFDETLSDAVAAGELYSTKGAGIVRFSGLSPVLNSLYERGKIKPERTYIYAPEDVVRQRVFDQLKWALGEKTIKFLGKDVLEVDEAEEELRTLGLGVSESQRKFLEEKGFMLIPRLSNDPRYHLGNMEGKIAAFKDFDLIIFDGDEIIGYPEALPALAKAMKKFNLRYGYIEIVKQDGDSKLRKLMGEEVVRVHSVPKDELKKINKEEVLDRFVRAARERGVRLIYLRPFLPPQIDAYPVDYNLNYFKELKTALEGAGFVLGKVEKSPALQPENWQILLLGAGVVIGGLFLLGAFWAMPVWLMYVFFVFGMVAMYFMGEFGISLLLQKGLAFAAAIIFPSYAIISTFSKQKKRVVWPLWDSIFSVVNILIETIIGIFLMIGLLVDYRFMTGIETFPGVKIVLVLPILLVAGYFIFKSGEGELKERLWNYLNTKVSLLTVLLGLFGLGALAVLIARSGNFALPVPAFEKYFRNWLETILFIRPRTKEFLVGYPFLLLASIYYLKGKRTWLWLLAAIGAVATTSVFNTFSHIHTPIMVSMIRTFNGLALGILVGLVVWGIANRFIKKEE